jgi:hypothetical protein
MRMIAFLIFTHACHSYILAYMDEANFTVLFYATLVQRYNSVPDTSMRMDRVTFLTQNMQAMCP